MLIKNTIRTEVSVHGDKRYYLKIEWDKAKKCAAVIMMCAGETDGISFDRSTNYCISNLVRLGYGSCYILNLFSNGEIGDFGDEENLKTIESILPKADEIIYAAGTGKDGYKCAVKRKEQVMELLKSAEKPLLCISDDTGKKFYHPLCPRVKEWILSEFIPKNTEV